jgi:hypothetical protein
MIPKAATIGSCNNRKGSEERNTKEANPRTQDEEECIKGRLGSQDKFSKGQDNE